MDFNEILSRMTREEKEELMKLLEQKAEIDKYSTLKKRKYSLIQEAAICSTAKIVGYTASNRNGKSLAFGDLVSICSTGIIPDSLKKKFPKEMIREGAYWASAYTFQMSKDISEGKIFATIPPKHIARHNKEQRKLFLDNGNEIGFKSTESQAIAYAGVSRVLIWADEEHPKDIYTEMYMRTIDCGGKIRMSFTPVKGLTWAYNDLYKKAYKLVSTINIHGIPEEAGLVHTPEELELMRDRQLVVKYNNDPDADHNIEFYTGAMYDNPFLPLAEIHNAELECKNDIGAYNARVLGRFTQLSGNKVFYIPTLLKMQSGLSSTYPRYSIFGDRLERDVRGHFTIFKDKKEGEHYVIGADVAQGLEQGDNSCVQVLSRSGCEQIACWCGKISPEKFADLLNYLGCYYNHAKMAPEINFHGFGVVNRLREVHKYPQLYYHYNLKEEVLKGKSSVSQVKAYGWLTTEASKAMMIQDLSAYIRDGHIKLHDWHTVDELITYIYDPNGKMTAMGGCLDDRVIALGIALQLFKKTSPAITQTTLHPYKPRVSERMGY